MKLYAVTFGCFRTTCVAASAEAAVTDALYNVRPWYIDTENLSARFALQLERRACDVKEVEQRPYAKSLHEQARAYSVSFASACQELGVSEAQLDEALTKIRTSAPASQEATNNPSQGENKE